MNQRRKVFRPFLGGNILVIIMHQPRRALDLGGTQFLITLFNLFSVLLFHSFLHTALHFRFRTYRRGEELWCVLNGPDDVAPGLEFGTLS